MTIKAIAWDIDGTLVDSEPLHHRALIAGCRDFGVDVSDLPDQAFRGIHMRDVWLALRDRLPATLAEQDWLAAIARHYVDHHHEVTLIEGAVETVRVLQGHGLRQVCVSNSERAIVDANIDALGIADALEFSISFDDVSDGKPSPVPYAEACRRLGLAPPEVLAVEDSRTGAASARAAGLAVAGCGWAHWQPGDVDTIIARLGELSFHDAIRLPASSK